MDNRSLNIQEPATQGPSKPPRRRYGPDFVGPRPPFKRPASVADGSKNLSLHSLTGGESKQLTATTAQNPLFCKPDWLTCSTLWDRLAVTKKIHFGSPFDETEDSEYIENIGEFMPHSANFDLMFACRNEEFLFPVKVSRTVPFDFCEFASKASFVDPDTGELVDFMKIGYHVDKDAVVRWIFQITGSQCKYFDWDKVKAHLAAVESVITRLDLAVDDLTGLRSVALATQLYKEKKFVSNGRNPKHRTIGGDDGQSIYIGKKVNGKELCVYEKGKESGSVDHPDWVRWEQRFGNRDRVIPYDALTNTAAYFLGAHKVLAEVFPDLESATIEKIRITTKQQVADDLAHFFKYASLSCGKGVDTLRKKSIPDSVILDNLARLGTQKSVGQPSTEDASKYFETCGIDGNAH